MFCLNSTRGRSESNQQRIVDTQGEHPRAGVERGEREVGNIDRFVRDVLLRSPSGEAALRGTTQAEKQLTGSASGLSVEDACGTLLRTVLRTY